MCYGNVRRRIVALCKGLGLNQRKTLAALVAEAMRYRRVSLAEIGRWPARCSGSGSTMSSGSVVPCGSVHLGSLPKQQTVQYLSCRPLHAASTTLKITRTFHATR